MTREREPARNETVELVEDERIVARGSARTSWFVRVNQGWVAAREIPGTRVESLDTPAGSVWVRRLELELARGTTLMRTRSVPRVQRKTPLAHLAGSPSRGRRVERTLYEVSRGGTLERVRTLAPPPRGGPPGAK